MHFGAYGFVEMIAGSLPPRRRVLEVGSRNINGSVRPLFKGALYHGIDTVDGWGVDEVADGATFTTADRYDTIVCCEVLEHTPQAEAIIRNVCGLLDRDGVLIVTCAAEPRRPHSATDGGPIRDGEYYQNVRPDELQQWIALGGATVKMLSHVPDRGDLYLLAVPVTAPRDTERNVMALDPTLTRF